MERFFLKNWVVGGLASLLLAVLLSCGEDAGLGASIDTKAPTLSITYPDSGAAIRDSFILAGDCSDDKSISRILVTVKNLESGVDYGSYPAKVSVDQTSWQVELNSYDSNNAEYYNGWQLPDGKYEFSVTAYDNAGNNSGVSSRQFEIDNTPPVFIISNPGVVKSSGLKASAYGSLFTIDGTISDNHPISYMDVKIFRTSDGQLLSHETYEGSAIDFYREEDIATAGGSSVTIAQWSDTATQTAKTRYTDIYGYNVEAGTIEYFAQIALYDSAKVYKNPPKNSSRSAVEIASDVYGNSTSTVYLYDDVYTALMSAKKGLGLSAANLKDILAGLDKGEKATAALSTLSTNAKNTEVDANRLYFSLNPQANPTYTVNGYKFNFASNENQLASSGNTVSVTVSAGLDGTNIQPDLVKVWIKKYASKPTDEIAVKSELEKLNQKVIELTKEEAEFVEDVTTINLESGNDWILVYDYAQHNDKGSSVATKTFAVTLPAIEDYIELEKFYILGVTGHDVDEVCFSQNIVYGFEGNAAGVPPTFAFDDTEGSETPKSLSIWNDFATPKFSGTAIVSTGSYFVKEITAKLTLKDENTNATVGTYTDTMISNKTTEGGVVWTQSAAQALSWDYDANKWKIDLTKLPGLSSVDISNKQLLASLEISGKSSSGHSGVTSRDIHIDTVAPVVTMTSITPSVSGSEYFGNGDTNTYLNGNITIKGNVEEQNLKNVSYDILASTDLGKTLTAGDSILEDLKNHKTELGLDAGTADGNFDGSLGKQFTLNIPFATTAITKLFHDYKVAEEDAKIQVELVVTAVDEAGNTGSYSSKTLLNSNGKNYVVYQRTDRPKVTLGNAYLSYKTDNNEIKSLLSEETSNKGNIDSEHNLFGTTNNNKLQISFEDDDSVAEYKIYIYKEDGTELAAADTNDAYGVNPYVAYPGKTSASVNFLLPSNEGKYQVKIEAKDYLPTALNSNPYGEETVGNFFIAVDSGAPNITITKPVAGSYQNGTVQVEGTVSKKVEVEITGKLKQGNAEVAGATVSAVTIGAADNGVYKWTGTVTLPGNASGSYTLDYEAKDVYGQKTSTTVGFVVDVTAPTFAITTPSETEVFTAESMYTVKGTISDGSATSGIKGLYWTLTEPTATSGIYKPLDSSGALMTGWNQIAATPRGTAGEYTWIANIELGSETSDGTQAKTVYISVIDEAGNVSTVSGNPSSSLKITRDNTAPSSTLLGTGLKKPASALTAAEKTEAEERDSSGNLTKGDEAGNLILAADSALDETITYYATDATNGYKISGVVTEASKNPDGTAAAVTITATMNGTAVTVTGTENKIWTITGGTSEGTHSYEIKISDKAGNSVTKKISVIRDTGIPGLTVSNETTDAHLKGDKILTEENTNHSVVTEGDNILHKYLLSGKWSDTTTGTKILQYKVRPYYDSTNSTYVDDYSDWRDVSGVTQSTAESSWSFSVDMREGNGLNDNGIWIQGRAIDAAGNIKETDEYKNLKIDFSKPTVEKTSGDIPKYVKNGGTLVIEGTCADSYALDEINVVAKKDGTSVSTGTNGLVIENTIDANKKTGTFKITLTASDSNNGKWEFEVKAKDWVARESETLKFSTKVDTVKPAWIDADILVNNKTYTSGTNHSWYKNATLPFAGSLTENGSGIKEIRYTIAKADGTDGDSDSFTTSVQKDASGNVVKETFSTKLGEFLSYKDENGDAQANTVTLVAEDEAGNISEAKTFNIFIDSESPQLLSSDKSGTQYSNKSLPITVNGTASDDASGVDSVKLTITEDGKSEVKTTVNATTTDSFANWSATIPDTFLANLENKTYAVKATLTDKAGNSTSSTIFRIDVDGDAPKIENISLSDGSGKYSVYETTEKVLGEDGQPKKVIGEDGNPKKDGDGNEIYETETVYYAHNAADDDNANAGKKFSISGSVQDKKSGIAANGIKVYADLTSTQLTALTSNDASVDTTGITPIATVSQLPITDIDLSDYTDSVKLTLIATDNAGNKKVSDEITVKFDNTAPKPLHALDSKNKDIFFRIGENENDEITEATHETLWSEALDKDVGGKYLEGTYGNSKTIKIRGTIDEKGSGVAMIYYKVITAADLTGVSDAQLRTKLNTEATNFLSDYKNKKTGYFAPIITAAEKDRRVFYSLPASGKVKNEQGEDVELSADTGDYKDYVKDLGSTKNVSDKTATYATITSNYNSVLSGFSAGKNYLILVVVDNVGHAVLDSVKVGDTEYSDISLNVDETTPNAKSNVSGVKYTNKKAKTDATKKMKLTGTASDADAGLYSITLKQGTKEIVVKYDSDNGKTTSSYGYGTLEITKTGGKDNQWSWTATLEEDKFFDGAADGETVSVLLEAKDKAGVGNTKLINVATVIIDTQLDEITLTEPDDADTETSGIQINGTITLKGKMKDANVLPTNAVTKIEYKGGTATDWTDLSTVTKTNPDGTVTKMNLTFSGSNSFEVSGFDTTLLPDGEYQFRAVGEDSAYNTKESAPVTVQINQDSDRPILKITNITDLGATSNPRFALKYGTKSQLIATVTDDDGVADVVLSDDPFTGAEDEDGNYTETKKGHTDFSNGSVKFIPYKDYTDPDNKNVDGDKSVYIYIKDGAGKKFYTTYRYTPAAGETITETEKNQKTILGTPKIRVGDSKFDSDFTMSTETFKYTSDSNAPSVAEISALAYKADGTTKNGGAKKTDDGTADVLDSNGNKIYDQFETITASYTVGGTEKQKVQFKISAYDVSDIDGITLEVSYKKTTGTGESKQTETITNKFVSPGFTVAGYTSNGTKEVKTKASKYFTVNGEGIPGMVWTTSIISLDEADSGTVSLKVVPYDKLSLPGSGNAAFAVDNSGPEIKVSNPPPEDEVTGTVSFIGTALDAGSTTADTKWLIPTKAQQNSTTYPDSKLFTEATWQSTGFTSKSSPSSWTFELKATDLEDYDDATNYAQSASDGVYVIPFYVMSKDSLGNYSIKRAHTFKHNPDADRPKTTISYPEVKKNSSGTIEASILGGTIRVAGDAIIPQGEASVKAVYLQIGTINASGTPVFDKYSHNSGKLISDAVAKDASTGVNKGGYGYTVKTLSNVQTDLDFTSLNFAANNPSTGWWGIPVERTGSSWHFYINQNGEMDPVSGGKTHLALRAIAINTDGKVGAWTSPVLIDIDATAPKQTATLRQYATDISADNVNSMKATTSATAVKKYESGMYLKDDWYLTVQLDDESSLQKFSVKKGNDLLTPGTDYFASTLETLTGGAKQQYLFIKVDRQKESVSYTVYVTDTEAQGGHTIDVTYNLNIDNTAPEIEKVYRGASSDSTDLLENDYEIADSDYIFQMGGKVNEEGSGLERVVFYYVREGTAYGKQAVLDPLITTGTGDAKARIYNAKSNTDDSDDTSSPILTKREIKQGNTSYYLWAKSVTGTIKADGFTFEAGSSLANNKHIRKGGLIEIGGVYRKITSVSGKTVKFDTSTGVTADVASQTAYFPYAQSVDNTSLEKTSSTSANPFTFTDGSDDGDEMPEELSGAKSTGFTWNSTIHSTNIPDGPAKLVILAFDKAGNVTGREYTVKIVNSAPRLAKVFLGTDLNSNDVWSADEFVGYNLYNSNADVGIEKTEVKDKISIATASYEGNKKFSVKDKLAVIPEFVGGNGEITLVYKKGATDTTAYQTEAASEDETEAAAEPVGIVATANAKVSSEADAVSITTLIAATDKVGTVTYNNRSNVATSLRGFTLTSKQVAGLANTDTLSASNGNKTTESASFTFWDSTEETTAGVNSQNCVLHISDLNLALVDGTSPEAKIVPFYWTDASHNSLYEGKSTNGHIDLEHDLPAGTFKDTNKASTTGATAPSGEYDRDPKVSGKIVVTGAAYDNKMLKQIKMKMSGFNFGATAGAYEVMDTFTVTASSSSWGTTTTHKGSLADDGYEFFINESTLDQSGHTVKWTLYLDTSFVAGTAANDRELIVQAVDASTLKASDTATETGLLSTEGTANTAYTYDASGNMTESVEGYTSRYRMDVVPYITSVSRNSTYNTNRARSGATPLLRSETGNKIEGFNLDWYAANATNTVKAKYAVSIIPNKDGTDTALAMESVALSNSALTFTLPATAKDGYLTVKINDVQSLNNFNDDSKAYNKENTANVSSTDYWTDSRFVHVWQSDTTDYFAESTLPIYPSMAMGTGGTLYASWSNYSKSDVYYADVTSQTATQVYHGYDPPEETAISVAGENKVNVFYSANYHGGNSYNWTSNSTSAGGLYAYDSNAPAINCSRQDNNAFRFELFYHNQQLQQFKNLNIKRTSAANNGLIHVAYYDTVTNSIHYSEITGNYDPSGTIYLWRDNTVYNNGDSADYHEISWVNIDGKSDEQDENYPDILTPSTTRHNYRGYNFNCQNYETYTTADGSETYYRYFDNYNYKLSTAQFEDTARTEATGESLSLALTRSNYPVIAYYDADNGVLKVARALSTTPKGSATSWKVQDVLSDGSVEGTTKDPNYGTMVDYIACDIDSEGKLHIVFQNTKGQLCYIKSTNASANGATKYTFGQSVVVADSATNIDLTLHGKTPYISYLTRINSFDGMNIAFWDSNLDLDCDGTAEGGWETMTAPLNYKVSNVKSCIEAHPTPASAAWEAAVGFTPGDLYRVAYYVGNGSGH